MVRERQFERYLTWLQTKASYPRRWRDAAADTECVFYLTVAELERLTRELTAILMPFQNRMADPSQRPPGSVPVQLMLLSHPVEYPEGGETEAGSEDEETPG